MLFGQNCKIKMKEDTFFQQYIDNCDYLNQINTNTLKYNFSPELNYSCGL